jgi:predicted nucleotidyltransferase component of viral defense system
MTSPIYRAQVDLLLRVLPYVAMEESLALKGGTAINLFVRDMPRFSVDIDLTYLPLNTRDDALSGISDALRRIKVRLEKAPPRIAATVLAQGSDQEAKLVCKSAEATIKIEVNTLIRGHLWPTRKLEITPTTQNEFGKSAVVMVVSDAELYGGKICASTGNIHGTCSIFTNFLPTRG